MKITQIPSRLVLVCFEGRSQVLSTHRLKCLQQTYNHIYPDEHPAATGGLRDRPKKKKKQYPHFRFIKPLNFFIKKKIGVVSRINILDIEFYGCSCDYYDTFEIAHFNLDQL